MIKIIVFFFFLLNFSLTNASPNIEIVNNFKKINSLKFNFVQKIDNNNIEKGECIILYPKKIFCKYDDFHNKILVSNGKNLVIKNNKQYYRYPIKSTPFEFLLDKNFLINKINSSTLDEVENKYFFFQINENNNNINVFFNKQTYDLVGWQVEDMYQNLSITYIFNTSINKNINEKLFKLPKND